MAYSSVLKMEDVYSSETSTELLPDCAAYTSHKSLLWESQIQQDHLISSSSIRVCFNDEFIAQILMNKLMFASSH
jgi:hypothetical protein